MQLVGRIGGRRFVFLPALVIVSLVLAGTAAAADGRIQLSASGQAAARAAVIKRADLGAAGGWVGGMTKPDLSQTLECPSYRPKQSDLIVVGAAGSTWKNSGFGFHSVAQVLRTAEMVRLDWQRTVLDPRMLPCVRSALAKEFGTAAPLVSFRRIAFPQIADSARAYRAVVDAKTSSGEGPHHVRHRARGERSHGDHVDGRRTDVDRSDHRRSRGPAGPHPRCSRIGGHCRSLSDRRTAAEGLPSAGEAERDLKRLVDLGELVPGERARTRRVLDGRTLVREDT